MAVIRKITPAEFDAYAVVSSEFTVASVLECGLVGQGIAGISLNEKPASPPMQKEFLERV